MPVKLVSDNVTSFVAGQRELQKAITSWNSETLFCDGESVVNGRPLTPVCDSPDDLEPLTPNHLLLLRAGPTSVMDNFSKVDTYGKRWRHIQFLADCFWRHWVKEYLPTVQLRQKWKSIQRNVTIGDIVLIQDENLPRRTWPLGKVINVYPGRDGLVRSAQVKSKWSVLTRPVHKLCLLEGHCD